MRLKLSISILAVIIGLSFQNSYAQQVAKITSSGIGYLEYLPQDYNSNNNDYPIVIFLHGIGERGTTSTDPNTMMSSVQKVANVGLAKYVKYGKQYPFILISPQLKSSYGTWPANYILDVLNHVKKYLRINDKRIYITGLSLGGFGVWTTIGAYPSVFAAAVPICSGGNAMSKACAIAADNVAVWGFHGTADNIVSYTVTTSMINAMNACTPKPSPLAKTTLFSGLAHNIWDKVYNETTAINWMLSFTNGTTTTTPTNNPPSVSAGGDRSITLPTNEVYLQGSASDSDGSIASYTWTKTYGPSAGISGNTTSKLRAYNLVAGSYKFRLTVKDNDGASRYDDVSVTVLQSSTTNIAPIANAGSDKVTNSRSITLYGSGTDKDGSIVSYSWMKYSGGAVTMTNASSPTLSVSGMTDGRYYFRLTVKDDKGATDYDNMMVTVSGSSSTTTVTEPAPTAPAPTPTQTTTNIAPIANAGTDKIVGSTSTTLYGSGTDKDGKIVSYQWTQYGGAAATLSNTGSPNLSISGLREGKYYFRLTVKDDKGASDYDNMLLTVTKTSSTSSNYNLVPTSFAGPDKTLGDDLNSIRIYGRGYDKDGRIVSYKWTQYGGPDVSLTNASSPAVTVSGLDEGKYYFKLTVKDDDGAVDSDNILVVVNES